MFSPQTIAKKFVQAALATLGYRLERIRPQVLPSLNVLPLVVKEYAEDEPLSIVQIGANDGVHSDPIRPIMNSYCVDAILLEPIPWLCEQLRKNYAGFAGARALERRWTVG